MKKPIKQKAFSLIELSIVILIIGILIAGVIQGSKLYYKFKVQTARQLTQSSPVPGIKDLMLWLEPTMINSFDNGDKIEDGTQISTWYDINPQRIEKYHLTQNTSNKSPVYAERELNGLPSVKFDGIDDVLLNNDNTALSAPNTVFVVCYIANWSGNPIQTLIGRRNASTSSGTYLIRGSNTSGSNQMTTNFIATTSAGPSTAIPNDSNSYVVTASIAEGSVNLWLNGNVQTNGSGSLSGYSNDLQSAPLSIGATTNATTFHYLKGFISEVIIYSRFLTKEERQAVEKYLSKKYDFKLSY